MQVRWRAPGTGMGTVDLRSLQGDQVVIHYGGSLKSVDAYTFANSLISFADAVRAVSSALDEAPVEIRVEALGPGSFRAVVKKIPKGIRSLFKRGAENLLWAYIAFLILQKLYPDNTAIIINTDEVIIQRGEDRIIVPRTVYDGSKAISSSPAVQDSIAKTFEIIEEDEAVDNFGITPEITDAVPLVQIPRDDFPILLHREYITELSADPGADRRERIEEARLVVLKLWLKAIKRKWSFEWNGVPISAPISDASFLTRVENGEEIIGGGDALEVVLKYVQVYDAEIGVYVNDPSTFEIVAVRNVIHRRAPPRLPL